MTDSRKAKYIRSNALQKALSKDDDLWDIYLKQETDAATAYINERLARGLPPLGLLQGVVGAAANLAGIGSLKGFEPDIIMDLHHTLETSCRGCSGERGNSDIPYEIWRDLVMPEHSAACQYFDQRVNEGGASYAILSGMIASAGRLAGNIVHAGSVYDMCPNLHSTIEALFEGGCEAKLGKTGLPQGARQG